MGTLISSEPIIQGVELHSLKQIPDERGMVMHMLRSDAKYFKGFGEVYFSTVFPDSIKAWKKHQMMTQNFVVPVGEIFLVIYDDRPDSSTKGVIQKIEMGFEKYGLVQIPPQLWYGFKAIGKNSAMIVNCASHLHDPNESEKIDSMSEKIPYKWVS